MGTTADKLNKVQSTKAAIKQAIIDKGVDVPNDTVFADYPAKIGAIESGGGTPSGGWQPQPDWWDIEALFKADPDPNVRMYILITDSNNTITLNPGAVGGSGTYFKTSDGAAYNEASAVTHTWDISQDKPCSLGYKTRWVAVYRESSNSVIINVSEIDAKYVYGDNMYTSFPYNPTPNYILEAMRFGNNATVTGFKSDCFRYYYSLKHVTLSGAYFLSTGAENVFGNCYSLMDAVLSKGSTIPINTFAACYSLSYVTIQKSVTTIGANAFYGCYSIVAINVEAGWVAPSFNISASKYLSVSGLVDMFTKLGANYTGSTRTITIGAANIAKLTPEQIAIATNKNYTIA